MIVGIGNTIRGDDGIGAYVCSEIDQLNMTNVQTLTVHQLDTGLIDEILTADKIILVDASLMAEHVNFYPLKGQYKVSSTSSHHINANLLNSLVEKLYGTRTDVMMCEVGGRCFDIGEQLSSSARQNSREAVALILNWICDSR